MPTYFPDINTKEPLRGEVVSDQTSVDLVPSSDDLIRSIRKLFKKNKLSEVEDLVVKHVKSAEFIKGLSVVELSLITSSLLQLVIFLV